MPVMKDLFVALDAFCEEKGFAKEEILAAIEKGIVNAYKKEEGGCENAKVHFNEETNEVTVVEYYTVVPEEELDPEDPSKITLAEAKTKKRGVKLGDYFEINTKFKSNKDIGRLAANSLKQILNQEIRRIERERAFQYFSDHEDEMIIGTITDIGEELVSLDLGYDMVAYIKRSEVSKEDLHIGARINVYLVKVEMGNKGPRVTVSRSDKNLIKRLFENYIPEIKDGVIEICGIARDSGDRTKVCVKSLNPDVDALGSCLGPKSTRIKDIINALGGEKIDLYEYSEDPKEYITNALKPAEVIGVQFNQKDKQAIAIVPDDQFSLAIGKKGQNVRLAVQSSGWKIDIKSVEKALEEGIEF